MGAGPHWESHCFLGSGLWEKRKRAAQGWVEPWIKTASFSLKSLPPCLVRTESLPAGHSAFQLPFLQSVASRECELDNIIRALKHWVSSSFYELDQMHLRLSFNCDGGEIPKRGQGNNMLGTQCPD